MDIRKSGIVANPQQKVIHLYSVLPGQTDFSCALGGRFQCKPLNTTLRLNVIKILTYIFVPKTNNKSTTEFC